MIIDLLNFSRYYPGTEADMLFRIREEGISVPSFFCITKDFTEDELNNYLQNHFQHTERFAMRVSLSFDEWEGKNIPFSYSETPNCINVPKSSLEYTARKLFNKAKEYICRKLSDPSDYQNVSVHIIIQELISAELFGIISNSFLGSPINQTVIYTSHTKDPFNTNYLEESSSYCIYCHNDTDGILYGYEPKDAEKANIPLIKKLLSISEKIKFIFDNTAVNIKFAEDSAIKKIYIIFASIMTESKDEHKDQIVLDTNGVRRYYPGVTEPFHASVAMISSKKVISNLIEQTGYYKNISENQNSLNEYINGRLYINTKKLKVLKKDLYLDDNIHEFIRPAFKTFVSQIKNCGGLLKWNAKHKIAARINKMLDENLRQQEETCKKLELVLGELLTESNNISYDAIKNLFEEIISVISECSYTNYLNTLYINFNSKHILRLKNTDRKYRETENTLALSYKYREKLRRYHYLFTRIMNVYGIHLGNLLFSKNYLENPNDIFLLTYEEAFAAKSITAKKIKKIIRERKTEFEWYRSMPSFSKLIFSGEVLSAPIGKVDFICSVKDESLIIGCGLNTKKSEYPAVICRDNVIPKDCRKDRIYVIKKFLSLYENTEIGGLIITEQPIIANITHAVLTYDFPIICGAEHALDIIGSDDIVSMDSALGKINIKHKI